MKRVVGTVGAAVLAAVIAVLLFQGSSLTGSTDSESKTVRPSVVARGSLTPEAVLAIAPRRSASSSSMPAPAMTPSLQEFYRARSYAPLLARLKNASARTPEEEWMLAEILTRCAKRPDDDSSGPGPRKLGSPGARQRFMASIAPNDADRDKRIAAFDAVNFDPCSELGGLTTTRKDILALLEAGAAGGDPKARVALLSENLEDQFPRGPDGKQRTDYIPSLSDAQVETLRQVLASGAPLAMRMAGSTLMLDYQNMSLRDADDRPLDRSAFLRAVNLATCDYGRPCGPDADWVLNDCAFNGRCAANNLRDHMMFYNSAPSASQVMSSYEAGLRSAIRDGDWSFFRFHPGPNPSTALFLPRNGP